MLTYADVCCTATARVILDAAHDWLSSFTPEGGAGRHQEPRQHTGQRGVGLLERLASVEGASRASSVVGSIERVGTHFTCFTRTKARVLTQEALQSLAAAATMLLANAGGRSSGARRPWADKDKLLKALTRPFRLPSLLRLRRWHGTLAYADVCWHKLTYAGVCCRAGSV
jgi:hypothetical protein